MSSATGCGFSGSATGGRADDSVPTDLVDHPLALLEGTDPLLRSPLPRADLRPARETGDPTDRGSPLRTPSASSPPMRSRSWTRPTPASSARIALKGGAARAAIGRRPSGARSRRSLHRAVLPRQPARRPALAGHGPSAAAPRALRPPPGGERLAEVQRRPLAVRLSGFRRLVDASDLQHAALDQADRGRDRMGARDRRRDADRQRPRRSRGACHATRPVGVGRPRALSGTGDLRAQRQGQLSRRRQGARQGNRR